MDWWTGKCVSLQFNELSLTSGDWQFEIRVENTVRITCVFNVFSTRIRQVQNRGGMYMAHMQTDTQMHDNRVRVHVYSPPPSDHTTCHPYLSPLKRRPHSFMKWKISMQVIWRRGHVFYVQELSNFFVFFKSADY